MLKPREEKFINVKAQNIPKMLSLISSNIKSKDVIIYEAIISPPEDIKVNVNDGFNFQILIENATEKEVHINKGTIIGKLNTVNEEDIQKYPDHEINLIDTDSQDQREFMYLIKPTEEILRKRREELSPHDFDLSHLNSDQQNRLTALLLKYVHVFSKSLETLGHTDLVRPKINLRHNIPQKALPFPIPYHLQQEALSQLEDMEKNEIITRCTTRWSCPMLLVKKIS